MYNKVKNIITLLAMIVWLISSGGTLYYAVVMGEISMILFAGFFTMVFTLFVFDCVIKLISGNYGE